MPTRARRADLRRRRRVRRRRADDHAAPRPTSSPTAGSSRIGIVALSLVPLVGYAGQISLCQLSFAGIGGLVMAHLGRGGDPLALVWAVLIAAAVGALIALPALRLSGIYLALGTAAFAVILDRWVFTLPEFAVFGLFDVDSSPGLDQRRSASSCSATTLRPIPGHRWSSAAVAFALVVARSSSRSAGAASAGGCIAMKDSEAACATLGMNLFGTKLVVFALSAGIAGLGGALYAHAAHARSSAGNFDLVSSLQVFAAHRRRRHRRGRRRAVRRHLALRRAPADRDAVAELGAGGSACCPALTGIGLGRNPNGAVHDMREGFAALLASPPVLVAMTLAVLVAYGAAARRRDRQLDFVACLVVIPLVASIAATLSAGIRAAARGPLDGVPAETPLEWVGIDRPWTDDDVAALDRYLGTSESEWEPSGAARG